jgi:hypothetical protein
MTDLARATSLCSPDLLRLNGICSKVVALAGGQIRI